MGWVHPRGGRGWRPRPVQAPDALRPLVTRARSWARASPPGVVLSCVTDRLRSGGPPTTHARTTTHTLGRWEARVVRRRTGPLGPKPTTHPSRTHRHTATGPGSRPGARPRYDGCVGTVLLAAPRGIARGSSVSRRGRARARPPRRPRLRPQADRAHSLHVVRDLERKGAVFVDELSEVPEGSVVVLSAHGSAPTVHAGRPPAPRPDRRRARWSRRSTSRRVGSPTTTAIVLIGHEGHEEVEGTSGQAPDRTILVQSVAEAERVEVSDSTRLSYLTQTTLSVDETNEIVAVLRERFPRSRAASRDICYATQNRQDAIEVAGRADVVLVIGSKNSSNSNRLAEVSRERGPRLSGGRRDRGRPRLARGGRRRRPHVGGLGAEWLVDGMIGWLAERGSTGSSRR